jgi:hypothetical protein
MAAIAMCTLVVHQEGKMKRQLTQLVVIADYGDGLALREVALALQCALPGVSITYLNVPAFNTIGAGFAASQLARRTLRDPGRTALLINVDPRFQTETPLPDGAGAPFFCARLDSGVWVFSPNAGFSLSFVKPRIRELAQLSGGAGSGQFRSRDDFPDLMAQALRQNGQKLSELSQLLTTIPDFAPAGVVALWVDGYGNVKTSLTRGQAVAQGWAPGQQLSVWFGGQGTDYSRTVACATSIMGVPHGTFVLAPGSSGDPRDPYMEFAVRAGGRYGENSGYGEDSGAKRLGGYVQPGDVFRIAFSTPRHASKQARA